MSKLIRIKGLIILASAMLVTTGNVNAQEGFVLPANGNQGPDAPTGITTLPSDCDAGIVLDDGSFENGLVPVFEDVVLAQRFTIPADGQIVRVCVALGGILGGGQDLQYEIVVYDATGAGGTEPGAELARVPASQANDVPGASNYAFYSSDVAIPVPAGDVYVGIEQISPIGEVLVAIDLNTGSDLQSYFMGEWITGFGGIFGATYTAGLRIVTVLDPASIVVEKSFSDSNPAEVTIALDCTGDGIVTIDDATADITDAANFTVTGYEVGDTCTATESNVPAGYSSDNADCTTISLTPGESTCTITNQQNPVDIVASKAYTDGSGAAVDFEVSCDAGDVTPSSASASPGNPAIFTVENFPWDGAECDVTEPVPPSGFFEASSTCNDLAIVPSDSDTLCTITNASTRATFEVTKDFIDGDNPTEVDVSISCNTGLILDQSKTITENEGVVFVVTSFDNADLDCEITEDALLGYTPTYNPGGPGDYDAEGGCNFQGVEGGADNTCHIVNNTDFVDVEIEKVWVFDGSRSDQIDTRYELTLYCDAFIADGEKSCNMEGAEFALGLNSVYQSCKRFFDDGSEVFVAGVRPQYPSSHCWVDERVYDDAVEIDNGCDNIVISAGTGDSCVITNTVFFEGIPTLSQYGMAIMALLMLGLGLVGVRRFA